MSTKIQWCDETFNPWIGCTKVSAGCANCYAETIALRFHGDVWGSGKERKQLKEQNWLKPNLWNLKAARTGKRIRVFCGSMCDIFDPEAPVGLLDRLLQL